ncbi:type II toxin-antitoxin system TacA family antitoxin [Bartonella sp. CB60]|uniref:type II toxin-antitoxin system TacA family antitoxin n=1 Tax=Bartonella sp. CB60 TaxID=3113619 RepID=UPI00300E5098
MSTTTATARLTARVSPKLRSMLKRAAEIEGRIMTNFLITAVQEAAHRTLKKADIIRLSLTDQECFAQTLLSPPELSPALEYAFSCRNKLLYTE